MKYQFLKPYGNLFFGKVVDMLYFPIWNGDLPAWLPIWGGKPFTFFNAIFNVADSKHISSYKLKIIIDNPKTFFFFLKIEFK